MAETEAHAALRERGRAEMRDIPGAAHTDARDASTTHFNAAIRALSEEMA